LIEPDLLHDCYMPFSRFIAKQGFVVLDGGMGTELAIRGADVTDELWSARLLRDDPGIIRQIHYDYFAAGADVATTASYQATFQGFEKVGIGYDEAASLIRKSVEIAVEARDAFWLVQDSRAGREKPLIAASIGPYGAFLADGSEYRGFYGLSVRELADFHRDRLAALVQTRADMLAFETVPCPEEAEAYVRLLEEGEAKPAWISFSCKDGLSVCQGVPFERCIDIVAGSPQIVAIGVNCTAPEHVESLIRAARSRTDKAIIVYPNSSEIWDARRRTWVSPAHGPVKPADFAPQWFEAGARIIGGCCRTGIADIRALRTRLLQK